MTLEVWSHGLALVANLAIGAGLVVAVYGLMEQRLFLGAIGGLVLAVVVVWSQATIGEMLWRRSFEGKRTIVVVAGAGATLGIVGTMMTLRPEIEP